MFFDFVGVLVGVLLVAAAPAWACIVSVSVGSSTLPHQAGSNDRVRSTGTVDLNFVLAFLLFLELDGDLALRFDFLGEWLTSGDFVDVELPLMIFLGVAVAGISMLTFSSPSSSDEKNRVADAAADRLVPGDEK